MLLWALQTAFLWADLPYIHCWYYPDQAKTVFGFRIDVDGVYGENLVNISRTAKEIGLPLTVFVNKSLCKDEICDLKRLDAYHEIGNHGDIHNLYDSREENLESLRACQNWLARESLPNGPWYAGPRGMWNMNLGLALEELGYEYSSDFGLDFDGLPFFPRMLNRKLAVLQIPIHAYSVERAFIYAAETCSREPKAAEILSYFKDVARFKVAHHLPVFFYSHPAQFGRMAHRILPDLKHFMVQEGAKILTLSNFCQWWKERDQLSLEFVYQPEEETLDILGEIPSNASFNIIYAGSINVTSKEQECILCNKNKLTSHLRSQRVPPSRKGGGSISS
jgi:peptidoglycan/xylan/chitin deacetylase (PgdA/CDA1 family)